MTEPHPEQDKIDVLLPAATSQSPARAYVVSGAIGLWTFLVTGHLLQRLVADFPWYVKILTALLSPAAWFLGMVVFSQALMGLAQLSVKVFHLKQTAVKDLASILILSGLSIIAGLLLMDLRVIPGFLSGVWFAGCAIALSQEMRGLWSR